MVVNYPLSTGEAQTIRWGTRVVTTLGAAITLVLGMISVTSAAG